MYAFIHFWKMFVIPHLLFLEGDNLNIFLIIVFMRATLFLRGRIPVARAVSDVARKTRLRASLASNLNGRSLPGCSKVETGHRILVCEFKI